MAVSTNDLISSSKQQILSFEMPTRTFEVGTVIEVGDGYAACQRWTTRAASENG